MNLLPSDTDAVENSPSFDTTGQFNIRTGEPHDTDYCETGENCEECVTCAGDPCDACPGNTHDTIRLTVADTGDCDGEYCLVQDEDDPCLFAYTAEGVQATVEYSGTGESRQIETTVDYLLNPCAHSVIMPVSCDTRMGVVNDVVGGVSAAPYLVLTVEGDPTESATIPDGVYHATQVSGSPWRFLYDQGGLKITIDWPNYAGNVWHEQNPDIVMSVLVESGAYTSTGYRIGSFTHLPFQWGFVDDGTTAVMVITAPNGTITLDPCCTPPEPPAPIECDECCDCAPATVIVTISGTGTVVDGAWTCVNQGAPALCQWYFENDDVQITATKSGEVMTVLGVRKPDLSTQFSGSQDKDHKGACKRLDYDNVVSGGDTATATGSCTPGCAAAACNEFDPPVDAVPCLGCCPSCIPTSYSVVLSGVSTCMACMVQAGQGTQVTSFSMDSSFTLDRLSANHTQFYSGGDRCEWGDPAASGNQFPYAKKIGTLTWKAYDNTDCTSENFSTTDDIVAVINSLDTTVPGSGIKLEIWLQKFSLAPVYGFVVPCDGGTDDVTAPACSAPSVVTGTATATITPC